MNNGNLLRNAVVILSWTIWMPSLEADTLSACSPKVTIDLSAGKSTIVESPAPIAYSPHWTGAADADACAEIVAFYKFGEERTSSEVLFVGNPGETGEYLLEPPTNGERAFRIVLRAKKGDAIVGEQLSRDISLATLSTESDAFLGSSDIPTTLENYVRRGEKIPVAYDSNWGGDGVVRIKVTDAITPVRPPAEFEVRTLVEDLAPAIGVCMDDPRVGGTHELKLEFFDAAGTEVADPLTASYFQKKSYLGALLFLR